MSWLDVLLWDWLVSLLRYVAIGDVLIGSLQTAMVIHTNRAID